MMEQPLLEKIYKDLHEIAEVSFKEKKTTEYIASVLSKHDIRIQTFEQHTGLIAEVGSGSPVVGLRADIDALWQEVDGEMKANHSCGHDAHMTIGIGTLLSLKEKESQLKGTFRCLFQPAEEQGNGSLKVVKAGAVDDMDTLFGVHLRPRDEIRFGKAAPSIRHGAAIFFEGKIISADAHGARPHQGVNAIDVGFAIQQRLNQIRLSPMTPYSIKMTKFLAGGNSPNIIPGTALFSLDLRSQTNSGLDELQKEASVTIEAVKTMYQVEIEGKWVDYTPGAEVSSETENILRTAIRDVLGSENCEDPVITPGSDDFHFYTIERPHLKASMLALGADLTPGLHHPHMSFNLDCLKIGVEVIERAVMGVME
ncbi:M20 peptidase aminoacylase family protein [Jeotgalibacillus haloalkalitolerans]|uniref:M20 peptidase aminoacylase family protein n=1 Tax=Jeotgalibacillus haloalkalitolerans TaxID=3104292 RepID=A0ABU5KL05_9BACL|nr:M20 peptidase aminoacylase family protein [Jeotgalibacillus sp. HH7-29]MDZ5711390.1 M20 peptidase aminoacylase family protein [Jeotgalibacillus sp. HH7-29]